MAAVVAFVTGRGWNVDCVCTTNERRKNVEFEINEVRWSEQAHSIFTKTRRCIRGLPSTDESSGGAIHCSMNSLSERASDG